MVVVKDTFLGPPRILSPTKGHRCIILLIMSASAWYGMRIAYIQY